MSAKPLPLIPIVAALTFACGGGSTEPQGPGNVELTKFELEYDTTQPLHVNNRVPVTFALTGDGAATDTATRAVTVLASFVEAEPAPGADPRGCSSSAIDVELVRNGQEQTFTAHLWPTSVCGAFAGSGVPANLEVQLGEDAEPQVIGRVQLKGTPADANGNTLLDVRLADLELDSNVAVLPALGREDSIAGAPEDLEPTIVVSPSLVVNGHDPYYSALAPELVPPGLEGIDAELGLSPSALPGRGKMSYALTAASDGSRFRPLTIAAPTDADPNLRVSEFEITDLDPGVPNAFVHELFAEGETRTALDDGGDWAGEDDFILRACFGAEFTQAGNEGSREADDCRDLPIVLVRERVIAGGASSKRFDKGHKKKAGGSRIALEADLTVDNQMNKIGLLSKTEGVIELNGKLGKRFNLQIARAFGEASLRFDEKRNDYEVGVFAFNKRIYTFRREGDSLENDEKFSANKSTRLGGLGFGFGPVRVGFSISAGGRVGFEPSDALVLSNDPAECNELLGAEDVLVCGHVAREASPVFALTGRVSGGINIRIVKAEVVADLKFVETKFPLGASLSIGQTDTGRILVKGDVRWDLELRLIRGNVSIVGRVGFRRFSKSLKINLFKFSSPLITRNLLNRSMANFEELE